MLMLKPGFGPIGVPVLLEQTVELLTELRLRLMQP